MMTFMVLNPMASKSPDTKALGAIISAVTQIPTT